MLRQKLQYLDKWILIPYMALLILSVIMVFSASSYMGITGDSNPYSYLYRQVLFVCLGIVLMFMGALMNIRIWRSKNVIHGTLIVLFGLLLLVFSMPEINGARRWIPLGFMNLQPAELAKLLTVWYFSDVLATKDTRCFRRFAYSMKMPTATIIAIALLLLLQPDTGTPVTLAIVSYALVVMSGIRIRQGLVLGGIGVTALTIAYAIPYYFGQYIPKFAESYHHKRFLAVRFPFELVQQQGLQLVNSYQALARGGLTGVGISESIQKTGYLPEAHTDFILAIIGEELGLITILGIILAMMVIIGRIYIIGIHSKDPFYYFMCMGIGLLFFIQVCLNLGAVSGVLPITGVPFPFLSYGGSSLLVSSLSIGLVLNMRIRYYLNQSV